MLRRTGNRMKLGACVQIASYFTYAQGGVFSPTPRPATASNEVVAGGSITAETLASWAVVFSPQSSMTQELSTRVGSSCSFPIFQQECPPTPPQIPTLLTTRNYPSLMSSGRNRTMLHAVLLSALALALVAFPAGKSNFDPSPGQLALIFTSADDHHHGHSHEDQSFDEDPAHHERHAADHSHETPGPAAVPALSITTPTPFWRIIAFTSRIPVRLSGIDRPPRGSLTS